ncbi:MAG: glycosyltransferase, partial [Patescibacteria group bacterium]
TKEGLPYSILEAGLAGVPVVATDVGGVNEVIKDGETGILIEPKNSQALTEAILKLESDRELAKKLTRGLKKTVAQEFNFETMLQKTEWVYRV